MDESKVWRMDDIRAYHARREAERRSQREHVRLLRYEQVKAAVHRLAPRSAGLDAVYLYGSLLQPDRYAERSDIDLAVVCRDIDEESRFWQALEAELGCDVDLRRHAGVIAEAVAAEGECIYEREVRGSRAQH